MMHKGDLLSVRGQSGLFGAGMVLGNHLIDSVVFLGLTVVIVMYTPRFDLHSLRHIVNGSACCLLPFLPLT